MTTQANNNLVVLKDGKVIGGAYFANKKDADKYRKQQKKKNRTVSPFWKVMLHLR